MNNIVDVTVYGFMELNLKENEKIDDVWQKVKERYESVQVPFSHKDINRAHRVGMEYTEKNSGKKAKSIIVKFKSWRRENNSTMLDQKISKMVKRNHVTNHFQSRLI